MSRETTVLDLYRRILIDRVLRSPAIGKTTLLKLLYYHIGPYRYRIESYHLVRVFFSVELLSYKIFVLKNRDQLIKLLALQGLTSQCRQT